MVNATVRLHLINGVGEVTSVQGFNTMREAAEMAAQYDALGMRYVLDGPVCRGMLPYDYSSQIMAAADEFEVAALVKKALEEEFLIAAIKGIRTRYALPLAASKNWVESMRYTPITQGAEELRFLAEKYAYRLKEDESLKNVAAVPIRVVHTIDSLLAILQGQDPEGTEALIITLSRAKARGHNGVTVETGNIGV